MSKVRSGGRLSIREEGGWFVGYYAPRLDSMEEAEEVYRVRTNIAMLPGMKPKIIAFGKECLTAMFDHVLGTTPAFWTEPGQRPPKS